MSAAIKAHNERPAAVWSSGGATYDKISQQISAALEHCVQRLDPLPGERVLDVATGTGWASRLLARGGPKSQALTSLLTCWPRRKPARLTSRLA